MKKIDASLIKDRAWIEINLDNLENNINEIKKIISDKTKIMAVVKANAYGHGINLIASKLNEIGINDFAVATLKEGITLRENGIIGNILILGYTSINNLHYVEEYDLIQTIVDEDYFINLSNLTFKNKLKVHIKINTGMNRIGINYQNIDLVKEIYSSSSIDVLGIFTHLSVSDSLTSDDIKFTKMQIDNFNNLVDKLKLLNIDVGSTHIQSSYGILNYSLLNYDYVRVGIIMYGIDSEMNMNTKIKLSLKPVLSLKARVTSVKELNKDDYVSYGRTFRAIGNMKIATVSIGYADGYPRNLSGKNVNVMINGSYGKIIGRICMDQLIVDVTNIDDVKQGDIVTLIGEDDKIKMEKIALYSDTITNEIASRLGERLTSISTKSRIYIQN